MIPGQPCPFNQGQHKRKPWHEKATDRSGFACVSCSKTWEWRGNDLRESYDAD